MGITRKGEGLFLEEHHRGKGGHRVSGQGFLMTRLLDSILQCAAMSTLTGEDYRDN